MKKNILFINSASCGGAERMTILYAKILKNTGFKCKILIHLKPGSDLDIIEFIPKDIDYEIIETRHRFLLLYLISFLKKNKYDVVFSSMPLLTKFLIVARWVIFGNFKIVARCFNMPSRMSSESFSACKWLRFTDIVISQTDEMRSELIAYYNLPSPKVVTINNPVDTSLIKQKVKDPFEFEPGFVNYIAVGRISKQKDYLTMIEAFKIVLVSNPNSRLYIIGKISDNNYYNLINKRIVELHLENDVFFEGFQSNPYKYMLHSDVFLLSSEFEGLPNVLLEALFLSKPVVVTRSIPFIEQIVKNNVNGYLVEVHDSKTFAEKMIEAVQLQIKDGSSFHLNINEKKIINLFEKIS